MQDGDPVPQQAEANAATSGTGQPPRSGAGGCLVPSLVLAALVLVPLVSCIVAFESGSDRPFGHSETPSPSGKRVAIVDSYASGLLGGYHYDTLTISEAEKRTVVGDFWDISLQWLSDDKLVVTLERPRIPDIKATRGTIEILMRLGEGSHVESARHTLQHLDGLAIEPGRLFCLELTVSWLLGSGHVIANFGPGPGKQQTTATPTQVPGLASITRLTVRRCQTRRRRPGYSDARRSERLSASRAPPFGTEVKLSTEQQVRSRLGSML